MVLVSRPHASCLGRWPNTMLSGKCLCQALRAASLGVSPAHQLALCTYSSASSVLHCCCLHNNTMPLVFKPHLPARVGLLPLTAKSGNGVCCWTRPSSCHCAAMLAVGCFLRCSSCCGIHAVMCTTSCESLLASCHAASIWVALVLRSVEFACKQACPTIAYPLLPRLSGMSCRPSSAPTLPMLGRMRTAWSR